MMFFIVPCKCAFMFWGVVFQYYRSLPRGQMAKLKVGHDNGGV